MFHLFLNFEFLPGSRAKIVHVVPPNMSLEELVAMKFQFVSMSSNISSCDGLRVGPFFSSVVGSQLIFTHQPYLPSVLSVIDPLRLCCYVRILQ